MGTFVLIRPTQTFYERINLVGTANLALRHFNEICDPGHSYMAYVGGSLGYETPAFTRSRWDWVEAASYGLPGRIAARRLTGNTSGEEVEMGQRRLTLARSMDWTASPAGPMPRGGVRIRRF